MTLATRKGKPRSRPQQRQRPAKTVEFSVDGKRPLHTHKVRAFSFEGAVNVPAEIGIDLPASANIVVPRSGTLVSFGLGGRPDRKRSLLVDVTNIKKPGPQPAVRRVEGKRLPGLFYVQAGTVYAPTKGARVAVVRSRQGLEVEARDVEVEPVVAEVGAAADAASRRKRLTLSMSAGIPVAAPTWDAAKAAALADEALAQLGAVPGAEAVRAPATHDPVSCAACLWAANYHLSLGAALQAQWWNPFAVMLGYAEIAWGHQILVFCMAIPCR